MNNLKDYKIFYLIIFFLCHPAFALESKARIDSLSQSDFWLGLLYMEEGVFGYTSLVSNEDFFIDPEGSSDPQRELLASVRAFQNSNIQEANAHAICKYPARLKWLLENQLLTLQDLPEVECPSFNEWYKKKKYQSISLVFATGFLSNPASLFGHIFLKFNEHPIQSPKNLLNLSVNYGATNTDSKNPLLYAVKGLSGFYDALYNQTDFYSQNMLYGSTQLRDIWEYELNLTEDEITYLSFRMWEMFHHKFRYYFLTKNCAYFIADPLEKQLNIQLLNTYLPYSLPKHTIEDIESIVLEDGRKLVKQSKFIPSRQKVFFNKYKELNQSEQQVFLKIIKQDTIQFSFPSYESLPVISKKKLLDVLLDYESYQYAGNRQDESFKQMNKIILLERFRLPANEQGEYSFPQMSETSPTTSPKSSMVSLGGLYQQNQLSYLLRLRPASHDYLGSEVARAPNSELETFDLSIRLESNQVQIEHFKLLNIKSLNTSATGLPSDWGVAWTVNFAYEPLLTAQLESRAFVAEGQVGYSWGQIDDLITPFMLIGGSAFNEVNQYGNFRGIAELGAIMNSSEYFAASIQLGYKHWIDGQIYSHPLMHLKSKFRLSRNISLRVNYSYELQHILKSQMNYYW